MDRCPICNEYISNTFICSNCKYDSAISTEQSGCIIDTYRRRWLKTLREFEFDVSYTKLIKYKGPSSTVVVPYGIKSIEGAFSNNKTIKKVVLPDTIRTIGCDAFSFCDNLESINIPNDTTHILKSAFWGCKKLCVTISDNVTVIEEDAFAQIKSIRVSNNNPQFTIHQDMLIDLKYGVLLAATFQKEGLKIIVPEGVKRIGSRAFNITRNLPSSIVLPRSLESIGEGALVNVAKTPIIIPNSVSKIEDDAFAMIFDIEIELGNPHYISMDNLIIEVATNKILSVCDKNVNCLFIPLGIKSIADRAFMHCKNLIEISIPNSVENIGNYAFSRCVSLSNIVIPCSVKNMGHAVFDECISLKAIFCEHTTIPSGWIKSWTYGCSAHVDGCKEPFEINNSNIVISSIDKMNGHKFELFCAKLLQKNRFSKVEVTKGSGDQGVDILAQKDGIRYAIQCKNYSSPLGNTSIQEVNAGKIFYKCHVGVVMTNSTFTQGAKSLAQATGTLLWDKSVLTKMIENIN